MSALAGIQSLDERILTSVHGAPAVLVPLFHIITVIGGGWGLFALVPFAVRKATRSSTLWLFAALTATSALVSTLKAIVGRVRPCDALGWCNPIAIASPGGHSFPSGHAAGSFAFAAFVSVLAPRWAPLATAWAVAVALSRCVLGVHYPSDVVVGALLGSLVGALFARLARRSPPPPGAETVTP
ncbi:Membrane-associated phospholipid phosphatase [Minicystis rosea]|nr:Membrane-associated phospholipid phosphatase [Minicystis rosea]